MSHGSPNPFQVSFRTLDKMVGSLFKGPRLSNPIWDARPDLKDIPPPPLPVRMGKPGYGFGGGVWLVMGLGLQV